MSRSRCPERIGVPAARRIASLGAWLVCAGMYAAPAHAEPYTPSGDDEVVALLPAGAGPVPARAWRTAAADDLPSTLQAASRQIELGQRNSDPRAFGQADAMLKRFADRDEPRLALMRAAIHQYRHRFDQALSELGRVIDRDPSNSAAWWMRAAIAQTTGRFELAEQACQRLRQLDQELIGIACAADLASLRGDRSSYDRLRERVLNARGLGAATQGWLANVLAEMADRLGHLSDAEAWHRLALRSAPSVYVKTAYADFLLAENRAQEAAQLLEPSAAADTVGEAEDLCADAVLLRLAIARDRLGQHSAAVRAGELLKRRLAAARLRGDAPHLREEAMVALSIDGKPADALVLARLNWREQREPIDAQILAQAASAGADRAALDALRKEFGTRIDADRKLARWFDR